MKMEGKLGLGHLTLSPFLELASSGVFLFLFVLLQLGWSTSMLVCEKEMRYTCEGSSIRRSVCLAWGGIG